MDKKSQELLLKTVALEADEAEEKESSAEREDRLMVTLLALEYFKAKKKDALSRARIAALNSCIRDTKRKIFET